MNPGLFRRGWPRPDQIARFAIVSPTLRVHHDYAFSTRVREKVPVDPKQIERAIARLPGQSSKSVSDVLLNARTQKADELVRACEAELATRGSLKLSDEQAKQVVAAQTRVRDKDLREVIEIAFTDIKPMYTEEEWVIREIAATDRVSYADLEARYKGHFKKNDLSLVIGHLVYNRFGYFRHLIQGPIQSDVLIERSKEGGTSYRFHAEALEAFRALGLLGERNGGG